MRSSTPLVMLLVLLLAPGIPLAGASEHADFTIHLAEGDAPAYEGPEGLAVPAETEAGERYAWNLTLEDDYTVAEVRVTGAFDVARPKQVLPLLDDKPFVQLYKVDVTEVDEPARVIRIEGDVDDFTYRLGLPGPGRVTLSFERDQVAPGFEVGEVTNVTHYSFSVNTTTTEPALADLRIRPADGERDWVIHRTPNAATLQRFPVPGLDPEREYEVRVNFTDWSGNVAESEPFFVRTVAAPVFPAPVLTILDPAPGAAVDAGNVTLRVRIESEDAVTLGGVRLFVNNQPVQGFTFADGVLEYAPEEGFDTGLNSVNLEVTTTEGGFDAARWTFTVNARDTPTVPFALAVAVCVGVAVLLGRR